MRDRHVYGFVTSVGSEQKLTPLRVQPRRRHKVQAVAELVADRSEGPTFELLHGRRRVVLPQELVSLLFVVAEAAGAGEEVAVVVGEPTAQDDLTSQQVADLLNVSRPYVVKLARAGVLPHRMVGNRHRFHIGDVAAFREREELRRERILAGMAPADGYNPEDF